MRKTLTLGIIGWLLAPVVGLCHLGHTAAEIAEIQLLKLELKLKGNI